VVSTYGYGGLCQHRAYCKSDGQTLSLFQSISLAATRCARAADSTSSTAPLTARREARWRTLTDWLGAPGGMRNRYLEVPWCSSFTKQLASTSPLSSLSSEVPRRREALLRSKTSTLIAQSP